jgi:hypothetical protein
VAAAIAVAGSCGWSVGDTTVPAPGAGSAPALSIYGTRRQGGRRR